MQHWPTESSETQHQQDNPSDTATSVQHGFCSRQQPNGVAVLRREETASASPRSIPDGGRRDSSDAVSAAQLDEKLRRLSVDDSASAEGHSAVAGQRVIDYENAQTPSTPRQALGFKVIKRSDNRPDSVQLTDFPNELLTHVLSHLHPDSHSAIALVSKRFYSLVTTPHAWRMAFLRFFPGHDSLATKSDEQSRAGPLDHDSFEFVRSESRYFSRLTSLATWRSEYLLRTRLLRGLIRGKPGTKPGGIGATGRSSKKTSAVLTYNSKLPWAVTHIHADFTVKKAPRVIHGAADLGAATLSDSFIGKVEKWGFRDPFTILQLDEVFPNLEPYGVGDGPAACPNVMDVSQPYGMLSGEGFPGGRAYYRPINEMHGRYLGSDTGVIDTYPDIPKIPELSEAISAVWVAKSTAVPNITHSTVGIITGSTLGIVTTYALHGDGSGPRHPNGEMTARWVLSPGVPIVSIKVDDQYTQKRKTAQRVWAVALNALGEVFYLVDVPKTSLERSKGEDVTKNAWFAGRSVYWRLIDDSRRQARPDEFDKHALRGAYSPRSPADAMNLSKEQLVAEAREIEKFLRYKPSHFRKVCDGWDMRRRLEVDFANDDAECAGEVIVSIDCGLDEAHPPSVTRYVRAMFQTPRQTEISADDASAVQQDIPQVQQSIFGPGRDYKQESQSKPTKTAAKGDNTPTSSGSLTPQAKLNSMDEWAAATMSLGNHGDSEITTSALDLSSHALLTLTEDPLQFGYRSAATPTMTPQTAESMTEIPGRRTRMLAVGTKDGAVVVWNCREQRSISVISPLRIIQTESPEISCLALTALYLVYGGNDGLVQAWDPLASSLEPLRTLNGRSNGRVPRHMMTMNPALPIDTYSAARAIYLDPDPTVLRGITSFGAFLRYWSYSATHQPPGRKRRLRHADVHGRLATRRQGGNVSGYIAAETAELRREEEQDIKEEAWLRNRFGVGAFGDLTEEEALQYAEMISQETLLLEEQRRTSASDTGSAADAGFDTVSSFSESTVDTVTPEPSITGFTPPPPVVEEEDEYEQQLQQALRLSLMEATDDIAHSPRKNSSSDFEFAIKYKSKPAKKTTKRTPSMSPPASYKPVAGAKAKAGSSSKTTPRDDDLESALLLSSAGSTSHPAPRDDDLELALQLSLQENGARDISGLGIQQEQEEFPMLETRGKGKGKM